MLPRGVQNQAKIAYEISKSLDFTQDFNILVKISKDSKTRLSYNISVYPTISENFKDFRFRFQRFLEKISRSTYKISSLFRTPRVAYNVFLHTVLQ